MTTSLEEQLITTIRNKDTAWPDPYDLGTIEKLRLKHPEATDMHDVATEYSIPFTEDHIDELAQLLIITTISRSTDDPPKLIEEFGALTGDMSLLERSAFEAEQKNNKNTD